MKKIFLILFVLLAALFIGGLFIVKSIKTSGLPDYNAAFTIPGLQEEVEIYRDSLVIPHIYAQNEADLYFAVGFVLAQDRMWQMDLLRRVTSGRLSEILGKDMLDADLLMRSLEMNKKSQKVYESSSPEIRASLDNFSKGVNYYLASRTGGLPMEFKILGYNPDPWEPTHSLNLIGYMAWDLAMAWGGEIVLHKIGQKVDSLHFHEIVPSISNQKTHVFPSFIGEELLSELSQVQKVMQDLDDLGAKVFSGSNNWAVSGKRSVTGKPIMANDMHLGLFVPGIWYQMHQHIPGKLNVSGLVLPGQPMVIAGHNDSISWGMTNVMLDDMDFYKERLNPENENQYKLDGEWKNLRIENVEIKVKDSESVHKEIKYTHRGPVVSGFKKMNDIHLSMNWTGLGFSNEIKAVYNLNRANNWAEFRNACSHFKAISQNIVYSDTKGNIGLQCSAGVPIREGNPVFILPGDTSLYDWKGLIPFEELPYEFNPERGYVSSANNKTVSDDYPYYISHWFDLSHRIDRIREMIEEKEKLNIADFENMLGDFKSKQVEQRLPEFLSYLKSDKLNQTGKESFELLKNWDFIMDKNEAAPLIYEAWFRNILVELVQDELGEEILKELLGNKILIRNFMKRMLERKQSVWVDDINTPQKENIADIITRAYSNAINEITLDYGENPSDWKWGKAHTVHLKHPMGKVENLDRVFDLNRGPFELSGSYHTVCPYSYSFRNPYKANHGASHRHIYDLSNWENSKTVIPTGTSGIPGSEHYCDQTDMYMNNQFHGEYFSFESVYKHTRYKTLLKPIDITAND